MMCSCLLSIKVDSIEIINFQHTMLYLNGISAGCFGDLLGTIVSMHGLKQLK